MFLGVRLYVGYARRGCCQLVPDDLSAVLCPAMCATHSLFEPLRMGACGRYNRWWNEQHYGNGYVRKWGDGTGGERWDYTEAMGGWHGFRF